MLKFPKKNFFFIYIVGDNNSVAKGNYFELLINLLKTNSVLWTLIKKLVLDFLH